ncbi:hypothetical protein EOL70_00665 [Leucothrix sargassi]|nr:hypothetical protein EOL70_00665 [Leucothrix sargassi]
MSRTAESTIKGFLYQFHKTAQSILTSEYVDTVTVEGVIEDIDVAHSDGSITAIQCKYHESNQAFSPSLIYKPLLQMAEQYSTSCGANISYVLFVHTSDTEQNSRKVTLEELDQALESTNQKLVPIISRIPSTFDKELFLENVRLEFGSSLDDLATEIKSSLNKLSIQNSDVDNILYPNCINHIATLSCNIGASNREINRRSLEDMLERVNSTAITKWTLALKDKKALLNSKKKQISANLSQNSRERCIYFMGEQIQDFEDGFVVFVSNYLSKYHNKAAHIKTPIFSIDCTEDKVFELEHRLYLKRIKAHTGYIGNKFIENDFFKDPISKGSRSLVSDREFQIRLFSNKSHPELLNSRKCDDIFFIGNKIPENVDCTDIEISILGVPNTKELEFVLSMRNSYE